MQFVKDSFDNCRYNASTCCNHFTAQGFSEASMLIEEFTAYDFATKCLQHRDYHTTPLLVEEFTCYGTFNIYNIKIFTTILLKFLLRHG